VVLYPVTTAYKPFLGSHPSFSPCPEFLNLRAPVTPYPTTFCKNTRVPPPSNSAQACCGSSFTLCSLSFAKSRKSGSLSRFFSIEPVHSSSLLLALRHEGGTLLPVSPLRPGQGRTEKRPLCSSLFVSCSANAQKDQSLTLMFSIKPVHSSSLFRTLLPVSPLVATLTKSTPGYPLPVFPIAHRARNRYFVSSSHRYFLSLRRYFVSSLLPFSLRETLSANSSSYGAEILEHFRRTGVYSGSREAKSCNPLHLN
jgi:hypothetical protein